MDNHHHHHHTNTSSSLELLSSPRLTKKLPAVVIDPMEFLSRSWAPPAANPSPSLVGPIQEDAMGELEAAAEEVVAAAAGNPFIFGNTATSQLVMERIMSHSEVSTLTSGRLSHSSGPLTGAGQSSGSLSDSPPISPSDGDANAKHLNVSSSARTPHYRANKTVGRWLKERREKKKEETRAHNAQLHAAVSVAGVAAAVAAIATATAAAPAASKDEQAARTDVAIASAATLVAAQCVEAAEALGAEREHLVAVIGSAVRVRSPGDIVTLTAAAATALRGVATLKARALKEVWNIAAVIPVEKGANGDHRARHHRHNHRKKDDDSHGEIGGEENFLGQCSQELLACGAELLKRTRKGALHWKIVSVYLHRTGVVMLKMKSRHVAGTITKKKKYVVCNVVKHVAAWPGRHLLDGGDDLRYFGLKTADQRVIEFECRSERDYELWTQGVSRLLAIVQENRRTRR